MVFLKIAWRDIWRYKLRSGLTIAAVAFATFLVLFSATFSRGGHEQMIVSGIKMQHGHLQIHRTGHFDDPSVDKSFSLDPRLIELLNTDPAIAAWGERIRSEGQISHQNRTSIGSLMGIKPSMEIDLTVIDDRMSRGDFLKDGDTISAMIGEDMAKNLHADIGDELIISTMGYDHLPADKIFKIVGIYKVNSPDLDRNAVIMSLAGIRSLLYMPEELTEVSVLLNESRDLKHFMQRLEIIKSYGSLEIIPWQELIPDLVQFVAWDAAFGFIYLGFVVIIVACGVLMTILMSVLERFKEFGIMKALGTRPVWIFRLVMAESIIMALIGAAIGFATGLPVCLGFVERWGIDPASMGGEEMVETYAKFGIDTVMHTKVESWVVLATLAGVIIITVIMAFFPAMRAAKTSPVEAIRYI